jgi:hypothetical protein
VLAAVRNSSVASHDLSIEATDTSSIEAHAGTVAFQAANSGASAAVGVSAAVNTIGSRTDDEDKKSYVKASLEKSAATVPGIVTLTATAKPTSMPALERGRVRLAQPMSASVGQALVRAIMCRWMSWRRSRIRRSHRTRQPRN